MDSDSYENFHPSIVECSKAIAKSLLGFLESRKRERQQLNDSVHDDVKNEIANKDIKLSTPQRIRDNSRNLQNSTKRTQTDSQNANRLPSPSNAPEKLRNISDYSPSSSIDIYWDSTDANGLQPASKLEDSRLVSKPNSTKGTIKDINEENPDDWNFLSDPLANPDLTTFYEILDRHQALSNEMKSYNTSYKQVERSVKNKRQQFSPNILSQQKMQSRASTGYTGSLAQKIPNPREAASTELLNATIHGFTGAETNTCQLGTTENSNDICKMDASALKKRLKSAEAQMNKLQLEIFNILRDLSNVISTSSYIEDEELESLMNGISALEESALSRA